MSEADDYIKRLEERLSPETINAVINSDKIFYNEGVEACIDLIKEKYHGYEPYLFDEIYKELEQLKKPLQ